MNFQMYWNMQLIKLTSEMSIELDRLAFVSASSIDFFAAELIVLNKSFKIIQSSN